MSNKVRYLPKALEVAHVMTCTRIMGEMAGCTDEQIRSAVELAKNLFLYKKNSKGNAICRAVNAARKWQINGTAPAQNNVVKFRPRVEQIRESGAASC